MKKNLLLVLISLTVTEIGDLYIYLLFFDICPFYISSMHMLCQNFIGLRAYCFYINFMNIKVIHAK